MDVVLKEKNAMILMLKDKVDDL